MATLAAPVISINVVVIDSTTFSHESNILLNMFVSTVQYRLILRRMAAQLELL